MVGKDIVGELWKVAVCRAGVGYSLVCDERFTRETHECLVSFLTYIILLSPFALVCIL